MIRVVRNWDLNAIYVTGPGHGGPGIVANAWLEGTYTEVYPHISRDTGGMARLFRQFSFPGGIPSHVGPTGAPGMSFIPHYPERERRRLKTQGRPGIRVL